MIGKWFWHWMDETDGRPLVATARAQRAGAGLILKAFDGVMWMPNNWGAGPGAILLATQYYRSLGISVGAWAVLTGREPVREAQCTIDTARAGPRFIVLDVEPYAGFWEGTTAGAQEYAGRVREALGAAYPLYLCLDSRAQHLNMIPLSTFICLCDGLVPMVYWRSFGQPVETAWRVAYEPIKGLGKPIYPAGQGNGTPDEWRRFIALANACGCAGVSVWRLGVTPEDTLTAIGGLEVDILEQMRQRLQSLEEHGEFVDKVIVDHERRLKCLGSIAQNINDRLKGVEARMAGGGQRPSPT